MVCLCVCACVLPRSLHASHSLLVLVAYLQTPREHAPAPHPRCFVVASQYVARRGVGEANERGGISAPCRRSGGPSGAERSLVVRSSSCSSSILDRLTRPTPCHLPSSQRHEAQVCRCGQPAMRPRLGGSYLPRCFFCFQASAVGEQKQRRAALLHGVKPHSLAGPGNGLACCPTISRGGGAASASGWWPFSSASINACAGIIPHLVHLLLLLSAIPTSRGRSSSRSHIPNSYCLSLFEALEEAE